MCVTLEAEGPVAFEWHDTYADPPPPGERVLTSMKHGLIEGTFDPADQTFYGYYWRDMEWFADKWTPLPPSPNA